MQGQGQGHGAFELPTTSEAVHAGGDDRSPLAGLSGTYLTLQVYRGSASLLLDLEPSQHRYDTAEIVCFNFGQVLRILN